MTELAGAIRTVQGTKAGSSALMILGLAGLVLVGFLALQIGKFAFSQGAQAVNNLPQRQPTTATNLGASGVQTPQTGSATQNGMNCSNISGRMVERLGHKNGCSGGNLSGYRSPSSPSQPSSGATTSSVPVQPTTNSAGTVTVTVTPPKPLEFSSDEVAPELQPEAVALEPSFDTLPIDEEGAVEVAVPTDVAKPVAESEEASLPVFDTAPVLGVVEPETALEAGEAPAASNEASTTQVFDTAPVFVEEEKEEPVFDTVPTQ